MTYPTGEIVTEQCDWIAFTVPFYKDLKWPDFIEQKWKDIRPFRKGYDKAQENSQGVQILWHTTNAGQGKHVILNGSTLTRINRRGEILKWVQSATYHVTRLDLCIDFINSNINPRNATYYLERKLVKTHARSIPQYEDKWQGGYTQYVGKKSSETFLRIYDKSFELQIKKPWIRAEIVFSGDRATHALKTYLQCESVSQMVNGFVEFPRWKKWNTLVSRGKAQLSIPPKETSTRAWLMGQVAKSIAKEMALEDSHEFWINFQQKIREEYFALTQTNEQIDW